MVALDTSGACSGLGRTRAPIAASRRSAYGVDPATARGRAFGFDEAADTAGAVAGPLAAMAIVGLAPGGLHGLHNFNVVFWLAAIPGILAAVSIIALVVEREHPILEETSLIGSLRLLPSSFRRYLAGVFVFGCGDFSHTMLNLYAVQSLTGRYGQSAGTIAIGLYALHNVLYAVGSYPAGVLADRYGKGRFLLAAYALAVLMNLILIVATPSVATLLVVFTPAGPLNGFSNRLSGRSLRIWRRSRCAAPASARWPPQMELATLSQA